MYEDDADAAECITFETETYTTRTGKQKTRQIKVPLHLPGTEPQQPGRTPGAGPSKTSGHYVPNDVEMTDDVPVADPKPKKVSRWRHRVPLNVIKPGNRLRGITYYNLWTALTVFWKLY